VTITRIIMLLVYHGDGNVAVIRVTAIDTVPITSAPTHVPVRKVTGIRGR
jgi:hypothetical protein